MAYTPDRSVSGLLSQTFNQLSALIRGEINLAQAEVTATMARAAAGAGLLGAAALMVIPALVLLLMALAALLTYAGLPSGVSDLLSGIFAILVAGILAAVGMNRLRADALRPRRTLNQLHRDAAAVKGQLS